MPECDEAARAEFLRLLPVSHETAAKFDRYAALLREWNQKFNLVAESTLPHVWRRHFLDSAQLTKFIPASAAGIADLGSGAGFPGLVLAILGGPKMHLVESTGKKCDFLRAVIGELGLNAVVYEERVEGLRGFSTDVVTARALKPLPEALKLAKPLMKKESLCIFLKGKQADAELTESAKYWKFACETFPSLSDSSGRVLIIRNLERQTKVDSHGAKNSGRKK